MRIGGASWSYRALKERYIAQRNTANVPRFIASLTFMRGILELSKIKFELFIKKRRS